jgi:hypothetical protein
MRQHYHWRALYAEPGVGVYRNVWIEEDGSLHNPHQYPDEEVRVAVLKADARQVARKTEASERAVATRRRRQAAKIHEAAKRILSKIGIGKQDRCFCCSKVLTDATSIDRGIGSDCWQHVLVAMESRTTETPVSDDGVYTLPLPPTAAQDAPAIAA